MGKIKVMINGLPGNLTKIIAKALIADEKFQVIPYSLTGDDIKEKEVIINQKSFTLIKSDKRNSMINKIIEDEKNFICVDFTHPNAVNQNATFYIKNNINFVMGTTGGDREALLKDVRNSNITAVIAPNMSKQIVAFCSMIEYMANLCPMLFEGYNLEIKESHQSTKKDKSGTAKAMLEHFNKLGLKSSYEEIEAERDPQKQKEIWQVPEEHINGHAWHTYTISNPNKNAVFELKHNINGREIYIDGTKDAIKLLDKKAKAGIKGKVFTMRDILENS